MSKYKCTSCGRGSTKQSQYSCLDCGAAMYKATEVAVDVLNSDKLIADAARKYRKSYDIAPSNPVNETELLLEELNEKDRVELFTLIDKE